MPKLAPYTPHLTGACHSPLPHDAAYVPPSVQPDLPLCLVRPPEAAPTAPIPASPASEPLRGSDKVFLRLGNFVCTGLLTFKGRLPREAVLQGVQSKLLKMPRFSQRVNDAKPGAEQWQRDPAFDPRQHVRTAHCAGGADSPALMAVVDGIIETPLDMQRPLWDMTVIDCNDGNTVLLTRVHHAVADGMRLMQAVLQCDDDPTRWDQAKAEMTQAITQARARPAASGVLGTVASWAGSACQAGTTALTLAQMLARRADPMTSLKEQSAVTAGWSGAMPAWPVQEIKDLAHALGGPNSTINDVLLALLTGAMRRLLLQRGDKVSGLTVRCLQAVNMLPVGDNSDLGNSVGSAMVPLPVHAATPRARFEACQATNRALKASAEPAINAAVLGVMGGLPASSLKSMFNQVSNQATCAMSNIKGPTRPLHLFGHAVEDMRWFVSAIGNIGVFAPVISYAGKLRMCLQLDRKLKLPITAFQDAVADELLELKGMVAKP